MGASIDRPSNGNIQLTITIPWEDVSKAYEEALAKVALETEIPGFRKGKAPKEKVEQALDKNKLYEEVLKKLIPLVFSKAVSEFELKPIISPRITLKKAKEKEPWILEVITCEKPRVTLGDYKKPILELKKAKQAKIWVPGQDKKEPSEEEKKPTLDELLDVVFQNVKTQLPPILLEQEVTKSLSNLIDQTRKLGLTVEQYLTSTGKTSEGLRLEYEKEAQRTLTLEFALMEIAEQEGITVEEKDINDIVDGAKTPEEKKALQNERYYLASILRRQKTIQYLASL
jgi:trigger factor